MLRYLPKPPATIYDIGGGAGIYALWLANQGYNVHLLNTMLLHIEQALRAAKHANVVLKDAIVFSPPIGTSSGKFSRLVLRSRRLLALRAWAGFYKTLMSCGMTL
ncbi:MAG: hypothetical protein ACRCYY_00985 [Trueperaceae bacterium]